MAAVSVKSYIIENCHPLKTMGRSFKTVIFKEKGI